MALIGPADQFWRLRLVRVDDTDELDLEWRDDVLYRPERPHAVHDTSVWRVEAVHLDDDSVSVLGDFGNEREAREALAAAEEDLQELTVKGFSERYHVAS